MSVNHVEQFRTAMQSAGVTPPEAIIDDGALHRFNTNGKSRDDAGWYVLHGDGIPAGAFGDFRAGVSETFCANVGRALTEEERRAKRERMEAIRRQRETEEARKHADAAGRASAIWEAAEPAAADHPYLARKHVQAHGLRIYRGELAIRDMYCDGALIVPLRDSAGAIQTLEFIGPGGEKRFLPGGKKAGAYFSIGNPNGIIVVAEGFATAASVHESTGHAVAAAIDAGNLVAVTKIMRTKYRDAKIIVAGDNDTTGTGQRAALEAAQAVNGRLAIPATDGADWNDMHGAKGLEAVRVGIECGYAPSAGSAMERPPFDEIPLEAYEDEPCANGTAHKAKSQVPGAVSQAAPRQPPIAWDSLEGREPPAREWIIPHWIPAGHLTLLAGRGGIGKTLVAQHIASALALGHEYIEPLESRRVLMWAGEDDEAELWRRQVQISHWMGKPLSALTERFYLHSYAGADITLMAPVMGALTPTQMLTELREQVADYRAEVVILDNVARLYGGSENDRHAVTTFCALVQGACAPAAVILLGHPAKAAGSEYSGSTAWEGAVRARLYLSDGPPDQEPASDAPIDDRFRYLSRRKANYSALDIRRLSLIDGVLIPDTVEAGKQSQPRGEFAKDVVRRAIHTLAARGIHGTASTASSNYLPRLARQYRLLDTATEKTFAAAMREMILAGEIVSREVGRTSDRHPRSGLVLP